MTWMVVLAAILLGWASPAAADLQGVGSEAAVGANGTGEACRLRVVQDEPGRGSQRLSFYCDGWSTPSGTLFRFRVSRVSRLQGSKVGLPQDEALDLIDTVSGNNVIAKAGHRPVTAGKQNRRGGVSPAGCAAGVGQEGGGRYHLIELGVVPGKNVGLPVRRSETIGTLALLVQGVG